MKPIFAFFALIVLAATSVAQPAPSDQVAEAYRALETKSYWVHSSASSKVDTAQLDDLANKLSPTKLRVLVVPQLGRKWVLNGKEQRGAYAKWLYKDQLGLSNGIVIVFTKRGIAGYTETVPKRDLTVLNNQAATRATKESFTPAIVWLGNGIHDAMNGVQPVAATSAGRSSGSSDGGALFVVFFFLAVGAFYFVTWKASKKRRIQKAQAQLRAGRDEAIEGISYLDSYDGLIQEPYVAPLRAYREAANAAYEKASDQLAAMRDVAEAPVIRQNLEEALRNVNEGKNVVAEATGGSKTAFALPESLGAIDQARSPLFEPKAGVCFFTGQYSDQLRPVDISIAGQRRTVMASPEAVASLQSGQAPQIAGQQVQGQFTPWYRIPDYDPMAYRGMGYGGGSSILSDLLLFSAIDGLFDPFGRHRGWGGGGYDNSWSNNQSLFDNSNSFNSSSDDNSFDSSGGFDFRDSDSGGDFDSGGGDFGGGDSGGDSGGGDFGGDF